MKLPLEDIKVIEAAEGVAGPYCGRLLAALGADVVKVERPPHGDWSRGMGPFIPDSRKSEASTLYLYNNMGKKSVLLDWSTEDGMERLRQLVSDADVLIEDWNCVSRGELQLPLDHFTSEYPGLIELCVTPFGLSGPYSSWKSTPIVQLAMGGYLYLTGEPGEAPLMLPGHQPDHLTGLNAHNAIEIALWERDQTGEGQFLELSMLETLGTLHQTTLEMETYYGVIRKRNGRYLAGLGQPPLDQTYGITTLPCKDGFVCFGISTEDQWERLCAMLGREDLLGDPDFDIPAKRNQRAEVLDGIIEDWMSEKTRYEVFEESSTVWGLPVAPVLNLTELRDDPQFKYRALFQETSHPDVGYVAYPTFPFLLAGMELSVTMAPMLGEHTAQVLAD